MRWGLVRTSSPPPSFQDCVFRHAFGGVDEGDPRAWRLFWQNEAYWRLCEVAAPSRAVRTFASDAVPGQTIEVLPKNRSWP